jgi:ankyrin repeat protein/DNA polymerase III epsilon subunit-like protein
MAFLQNWINQVKKKFVKNVSSSPEHPKIREDTNTERTSLHLTVFNAPVAAPNFKALDKSTDLKSPHLRAQQWLNNCVILDTETTGLDIDDEIVEIAIIDHQGNVLLDTRVRPLKSITSVATDIHGIKNDMVATAPRWNEIHEAVFAALANRHVVIFNAEFDVRMLQQSAYKYGLASPPINASCAMTAYAEYYGEWNEARQRWQHQSLNRAAIQQCILVDGSPHSALVDCKTTLEVIRAMAANPIHQDRYDPDLEAETQKKCGCDFDTLVRAYIEYAKFSDWSTSKTLAIDKCQTWVTKSIGSAGMALEWKETGIDPLTRWKNDRKLLTHRIEKMTPSEVAVALDAEESINQSDINGITPLMRAAERSLDLAVVQLLIDRGADINAKDICGMTALHHAVGRGFDALAYVQLLVKAGASVNILGNGNATPLSWAIAVRRDDVVAFLQENGSDIIASDGLATPLHFAARYNSDLIPSLLKQGANPNAYDNKRRTPIFWAMWGKNSKNMVLAISFLVKGGADIEWKNSDKETPLIFALKDFSVSAEVVDCIVRLGSDIKTKNRYGTTPLHFAAKFAPGPEKILVLLRHGADSENDTDRVGKTPKDYLAQRYTFTWPTEK